MGHYFTLSFLFSFSLTLLINIVCFGITVKNRGFNNSIKAIDEIKSINEAQ